jgi:hypothetical protein
MDIDRMSIAKQFTKEKLQEHDDIAAVLVSGSTTRDDALPVSDIDIKIVMDIPLESRMDRRGYDEWRDGIYLDAGPVPKERYFDSTWLLESLLDGSFVYDSIVLHDPTGRMAAVQRELKASFYSLEWVRARSMAMIEEAEAAAQEFVPVAKSLDSIKMCQQPFVIINDSATAVIVSARLSPHRVLSQLREISPDLRMRIMRVQGIHELSPQEVLSLHSFFYSVVPVDVGKYGKLGKYFEKKCEWMIDNGMHHDAARFCIGAMGKILQMLLVEDRPETKESAVRIADEWLSRIGWEKERFAEKGCEVSEIVTISKSLVQRATQAAPDDGK